MDLTNVVWINGQQCLPDALGVSNFDQGLLRGWGVFETMLAVGNQLPFWPQHWNRLQHGMQVLEIPAVIETQVRLWLHEALKAANQSLVNADTYFRVRLTVTAGSPVADSPTSENRRDSTWDSAPWWEPGDRPTVLVSIQNGRAPVLWEQQPGLRLVTYPIPWQSSLALQGCKHISYLPWLLAARYAHLHGGDDAILLNPSEEVVETSRSNLFGWREGKIWTPPLSSGCLPGVMRARVIETALQLGLEVCESPLNRTHLANMKQLFATSATTGMQRIRQWDQITFQTNPPEKLLHLAQSIQQSFEA